MKQTPSFSKLEAFARNRIEAHRYQNDYHFFRLSRCEICGVVPFGLTIEHHTGSRKGDFKGRIFGQCSVCGHTTRIFSFTGSHRQPLEGDEGMIGFFDEGVVAGMCSQCERNRVLVDTD